MCSEFYMDYMDCFQWQGNSGYVHIPWDERFMVNDMGDLFRVPFCAEDWEVQQLFDPI